MGQIDPYFVLCKNRRTPAPLHSNSDSNVADYNKMDFRETDEGLGKGTGKAVVNVGAMGEGDFFVVVL